jgi:REP element-mobilizing transposase RayT
MHSFTSCLVHCVWSTKNREPCLTSDLRARLWPYLAGIAKQNQMKTLAIGGASDHVHAFVSLPATLSIAKAMQLLKGNSSKWLRETFPKMRSFAWQALVQNQQLFDFAPPAFAGSERSEQRHCRAGCVTRLLRAEGSSLH